MPSVFVPDVFVPGVFESDTEVLLPRANPAFPSGLTQAAATDVFFLPIDRTRGEYGTDLIVTIDNWDGQRLFTEWVLSDAFTADDIGRHTFLQTVDSLKLGSVPLADDLIASLGASQQAQLRVVLDNRAHWWTRALAREVFLMMTGTIYVAFSETLARAVFRGQIVAIEYGADHVDLTFGEP